MRISSYGYSDNAIIHNNRPKSFGNCSPSIYKGATITGVILTFMERNDKIDPYSPPRFSISFSQHIDINKFIINNTIFDATNIHNDGDKGCSYGFKISNTENNDDNAWLINYFQVNYGKQITITLE